MWNSSNVVEEKFAAFLLALPEPEDQSLVSWFHGQGNAVHGNIDTGKLCHEFCSSAVTDTAYPPWRSKERHRLVHGHGHKGKDPVCGQDRRIEHVTPRHDPEYTYFPVGTSRRVRYTENVSPYGEAIASAAAGIAAGHLITHSVEDIVTDALGMTVVFIALELTKGKAEARGSLALGITAGALSGHYIPFGELAVV